MEVPPEATFEEYLGMAFDEDGVAETYIDPLSLKGAPKAVHASHEVPQPAPVECSVGRWLFLEAR